MRKYYTEQTMESIARRVLDTTMSASTAANPRHPH